MKRFSTKLVFSEVLDKVLPLDRGVLFTAKELLLRPGEMLRGYLAGKRAKFTKPLQFLLVIGAISLVLFSKSEFERGLEEGIRQGGAPEQEKVMFIQQKMGRFFTDHLTLVMMGIVPFLSLVGRWLYRKQDLNYAEHLVMNSYFVAGCSIISLPAMAALNLMGKNPFYPLVTGLLLLSYLGFYVYTHISFFSGLAKWVAGLKGFLNYLFGYAMYLLFIGLVSVVFIIVHLLLTRPS
ncbi:MAG: DUF3667 domain-containing protein [Saprospiraceae bacterium]|nr:DUF3667 domain-containing protein [Saprospiraceae bacterium]